MRHVALRFLSASVALACFATPALAETTNATNSLVVSHVGSNLAPADEYFGRYHMSILGIRNAIHDFSIQAKVNPDRSSEILSGVALTEDAVRDWSKHYPSDPLIPKTLLRLERLYLEIGGVDATEHAQDTVTWFDTVLPDDAYTQMAHTVLDRYQNDHMTVADDGKPMTKSTPEVLGVIPGLLPPTAAEAAATASVVAPTATTNGVIAPTGGTAHDPDAITQTASADTTDTDSDPTMATTDLP